MIIKNADVILLESVESKDIKVQNGIISEISECINPDTGEEVVNLENCILAPGFIDIHTHGAVMMTYDDPDADIEAVMNFEASKGVTSIVPTITSRPPDIIKSSFSNILTFAGKSTGTKIIAIHSEGPFLNVRKKGGMVEGYIQKPSVELFEKMREYSSGYLKRITIAPEIEGSLDVIKAAVSKGVKPSAGHTEASYDEMNEAIKCGMKDMTHSFNACVGINHREPGVLGAAFTNDEVSCEVICDFVHLHSAAVKMIYLMKGCDKFIAISDSVTCTGLEDKKLFVEDGRKISCDGKVFRLEDGTICGSAGTMHTAFCNLHSLGIPLWEVSRMVSLNPAKAVFADTETGSIEVGKKADFVVMDKKFNILMTFADGKCIYEK